MPFAKKEHASAVRVETKKMSGECCGTKGNCCGMSLCHLIGGLLLLANLVVMIVFFCTYTHTEAMKVGGRQNYKMVKQIYKTKAFQDGQSQQIQAALQQYNTAPQVQQAVTPTAEQADPATLPTQ